MPFLQNYGIAVIFHYNYSRFDWKKTKKLYINME